MIPPSLRKIRVLGPEVGNYRTLPDLCILSSHFTVYTNNNPLTFVMTSAKLNATGYKWVAELANLNFDIKYRPGHTNKDADFLSRMPRNITSVITEFTAEISPIHISSVFAPASPHAQGSINWITSITADTKLLERFLNAPGGNATPMVKEHPAQAQKDEPIIGKVLTYKGQGKKLTDIERHAEHPKVRTLMHEWKKFERAAHGILYRKARRGRQLVLPSKYHRMVYKHVHEDLGNIGSDRAVEMARERFYWPDITQDIEHYIRNVC